MIAPEISKKYNVDLPVVEQALTGLARGDVLFLAISGRMCAGKDTVAPLVATELGFPDAEHEFFARPLKLEINQVISIIKKSDSIDQAVEEANRQLDTKLSKLVVPVIYDDVKSRAVTSAYDRTDHMRTALQLWGTEVRRSVDEDYWVKKAIQSSMNKLASGTSVYVTDSRFPNEADAVIETHGVLARINVSPEVQEQRMWSRDRKKPTKEAINHVSETALNEYRFPIEIFSDDMTIPEVVTAIVGQVSLTH